MPSNAAKQAAKVREIKLYISVVSEKKAKDGTIHLHTRDGREFVVFRNGFSREVLPA